MPTVRKAVWATHIDTPGKCHPENKRPKGKGKNETLSREWTLRASVSSPVKWGYDFLMLSWGLNGESLEYNAEYKCNIREGWMWLGNNLTQTLKFKWMSNNSNFIPELSKVLGSKSNPYLSSNFKRSKFRFYLTSTQLRNTLLRLKATRVFLALKFAPSPLRSKELCRNTEKVAIAQMSLKWPWRNGHLLPLQLVLSWQSSALGPAIAEQLLWHKSSSKEGHTNATEGPEWKPLSCL